MQTYEAANTETEHYETDDLRIAAIRELSPPVHLLREFPITPAASKTVFTARRDIHRILHGQDDRLLVIIGPCSIHDVKAAKEYAGRLAEQRAKYEENLLIVMRVYFEKPRTTVGWKGLINDPFLDGSFQINQGLRIARELLLDLADEGMPAGTEYLDMITPQYIADLVSWGAIGARTTESQIHRELASGLSCPVGFKNGTDGNVKIAVDALRAAATPHSFLSVTKAGHSAIVETRGNEDCHIILRGGNQPNYDAGSVEGAAQVLSSSGLPARIMIDFSHSNSSKNHERQLDVCHDVAAQVRNADARIFGVMVESHLKGGRQDLVQGQQLAYGMSITDACLAWEGSLDVLAELSEAVEARRLRAASEDVSSS
jgi:3-deoxy-7-phosphoheptulonate synthase